MSLLDCYSTAYLANLTHGRHKSNSIYPLFRGNMQNNDDDDDDVKEVDDDNNHHNNNNNNVISIITMTIRRRVNNSQSYLIIVINLLHESIRNIAYKCLKTTTLAADYDR